MKIGMANISLARPACADGPSLARCRCSRSSGAAPATAAAVEQTISLSRCRSPPGVISSCPATHPYFSCPVRVAFVSNMRSPFLAFQMFLLFALKTFFSWSFPIAFWGTHLHASDLQHYSTLVRGLIPRCSRPFSILSPHGTPFERERVIGWLIQGQLWRRANGSCNSAVSVLCITHFCVCAGSNLAWGSAAAWTAPNPNALLPLPASAPRVRRHHLICP